MELVVREDGTYIATQQQDEYQLDRLPKMSAVVNWHQVVLCCGI